MTKRREITPSAQPLEGYAEHFDDLFGKSNQREAFRRYLEGLLLPTERHKTLTGLVNTEPVPGAQLPRAQKLQWFLSESTWDERQVQAKRLHLLLEDASTAPTERGVFVIDETGDRKDGHKTAHVSRQYLANLGKIDNGVVSVSSLWADERVYYPVVFEPYTPAVYFAKGKDDAHFRTKLKIALQLVERALQEGIPFRAVVADSFYGEDRGFRRGLRKLKQPYVLALKPSHAWYHPEEVAGTLQDVAHEAGWKSAEQPGQWVRITRTFRDGSTQRWWAVEMVAGPYGQTSQSVPSLPPPIPSTCPICPPGTWSPICPRQASILEAICCFLQPAGRGDPLVRTAHVGGAELQTRQTCSGLVTVPGEKRPGHPAALAARLVWLLLLLVSCFPSFCEPARRDTRGI